MYRTQCVLALLALYVTMADSFSWEIVVSVDNGLEFYDSQGTLTHRENITANAIYFITYDPVHKRVLFVDSDDDTYISSIYSFELTTKKIESVVMNTNYVYSLTYDPATDSLFWSEDGKYIYSFSLKPGFNNTINEKQLVLSDESSMVDRIAIDSCGGFIYWLTLNDGSICRARFNGSEREVLLARTGSSCFTLDQQTETMYWIDIDCVKCADFNGKNIRIMRDEPKVFPRNQLTASKDVLYYRTEHENEFIEDIRTLPKNPLRDIEVETKIFIEHEKHIFAIATNYNIEDRTRGLQNCGALKSLLENKSVTDVNDSLNVSTDESLLGSEVSGEHCCECKQGYSCERCDVSVCQNYCFQGDCSSSAGEQPKCSQISALLGIQWAPVDIPMSRRLQTLAAFVWIYLILFGEAVSIYLFIQLVYSRFWWMGLLYGAWFINDIEICSRGGRASEWVRSWTWWRYLCDYFPIQLVKTVDLDPSKNYMFACFPHGVLSLGAFGSFCTNATDFHKLFPGLSSHLITLGGHFLIPFFRDLALALGICSSSEQSLLHLLDNKKYQGNCACMIIGGAAEALDAHPKEYKVILSRRKGFIRVAMKSGASLVPVFSFGETDLFRPPNNPENSLLRRFQEQVRKYTGISPMFPMGRGLFQYSYGVLPMRAPVTAVVGAPMEVKRNLEPTNEEIDAVHAEFTQRLKTLFETEKIKYLKYHEDARLVIT